MSDLFDARRGRVEQARGAAAQLQRISGFTLTTGAGEVAVDVAFPVWFIEKPAISAGGDLDDNEIVLPGAFPTVSVVVLKWAKTDRGMGTYYIGATLGIVTTGHDGQRLFVHWQAEGNAMVNPVGGAGEQASGTA